MNVTSPHRESNSGTSRRNVTKKRPKNIAKPPMAKYAIAGRRMSCDAGGTDARRKRRYFNPAAPESGRRTNPRRQPFSGGADASDGAAGRPAAGFRVNRTPPGEKPME